MWPCPRCKRAFTRVNQRHSCAATKHDDVLRDRPESLKALYSALEKHVEGLGPVEVVAKERYVLFRSKRIFADLSVMKNALRLAIHVGRRIEDPMFIKVVSDERQVTHVVKLTTLTDLDAVRPLLTEAYAFSLSR